MARRLHPPSPTDADVLADTLPFIDVYETLSPEGRDDLLKRLLVAAPRGGEAMAAELLQEREQLESSAEEK